MSRGGAFCSAATALRAARHGHLASGSIEALAICGAKRWADTRIRSAKVCKRIESVLNFL